jgi:hypothetical protein
MMKRLMADDDRSPPQTSDLVLTAVLVGCCCWLFAVYHKNSILLKL